MSIAPKLKSENNSISVVNRIEYNTKKAVKNYFERPMYYMFYIGFLAAFVAALFSIQLSEVFYIILTILALILLLEKINKKENEKKDTIMASK
jgi:4-hydroxybenzoate polyprenyltransferase